MAPPDNPMTSCQKCQTEVTAGSNFCPECGERLPEMVTCDSCGAEMQQGWKACPTCGNRVDASARASLNITNAVVNKVDRSHTVDWSAPIGGDVSGTLITFNLS